VLILGDRRPYQIEVQALVEAKNVQGKFEAAGSDTALAKKYAVEIKAKLDQGREGRNVIDEFRVF
jgi:hypothetical protein